MSLLGIYQTGYVITIVFFLLLTLCSRKGRYPLRWATALKIGVTAFLWPLLALWLVYRGALRVVEKLNESLSK